MITWMQKHKKYLVITIWISTIAFVGAGFVGWGAYDMNNNRAKSVAKVGDRSISIQEFQQTYSELYAYYSNLSNGQFTQEKADEMGLDKIALDKIIQDTMLLNFADSLGLSVTNEDMIATIIADKNFQVNGKFDRATYEEALRRSRISPKDYENGLKNKILLNKLFSALNLKANTEDIDMLGSSYFMQDRVSIQVLKADKTSVSIDENELKELWEKTKNNYLTKAKYDMDTTFIEPVKVDANETVLMEFYEENRGEYRDSSDKLLSFTDALESVKKDFALKNTRKFALEEYLKIKKGESNPTSSMSVLEDSIEFPVAELKDAKAGDVLKPFEYKNGYLIVKLKTVATPQVMSYEEAKANVIKEYEKIKSKGALEAKAKSMVDTFNGTDIGFISRDTRKSVNGLSDAEFLEFVMRLFETTNKKGYIVLEDKAVIYNIMEQKLLDSNKIKEYNELLTKNADAIKNGQLGQDLLMALQKRYDVELYYKR
ncbi:putative periplasmic folding chaperone [Campylobacter iguaniorum]|uniref:peptidylprolyl isomerase n=1 Tax=Campylobacter iguaniorum TaxID=1244531 RepID=UPI0007C8C98B|nr:peptidylprolyl isomerase [Campylobacter iguaniorum]ANE35619.1 putative periplasmic folding chaperone [Campylobacter iguaniorum]